MKKVFFASTGRLANGSLAEKRRRKAPLERLGLETRRGVLDLQRKRPQPCAYACGRSVYTVYAVAMCNICRRAHGLPIFNE